MASETYKIFAMDSILHYHLSLCHHVAMQSPSPSAIPFTSSYSRSCIFPYNSRLECASHFPIGHLFGRRCMGANCIRASSDVLKTAPHIPRRKNLAVFLSGGGSNFKAIHNATLENTINGNVVVVVSDKPGSKGCEYAKENNIAIISFPRGKYAPEGISETELITTLRSFAVDYLILAGYLKFMPEQIVKAYPHSILNVHPALLPAFGGKGMYGQKVHEAVIRSGARLPDPTEEKFSLSQNIPEECDFLWGHFLSSSMSPLPQSLHKKLLQLPCYLTDPDCTLLFCKLVPI